MAAATVEPVKAQKLRIMFKGTKLVEISTPARGAIAAADVVQPSSGLKPLNTGGRNGGGDAQPMPGLPADLVDFLSREMEDCLSPLGSWVDETLAGAHAAPGELAEAPQHPSMTDTWPPSLQLHSKGREADAGPWWEQAATPGGRSSEGCSTQEAALMDVPSPGSVSNGCAPMLRAEPYRQPSRVPQPTLSAWAPSQGRATADAVEAAAKAQAQQKMGPQSQPSRTSSQHAQSASQPKSQQPLHGQAPQHCVQSQQQAPPPPKPWLQPRPQAKPRPKPVDWLAEEATPITASPQREASSAVQQRPATAAGGGVARARSGSVPRSAPSSPQVHRATPPPQPSGVRHSPSPSPLQAARSAKPAAQLAGRAGSSNLGRKASSSAVASAAGAGAPAAAPNGKAGVKRKGSPEVARASAPKRASPRPSASPSPSLRPAAKPAASNLSRTAPPGGSQAGRPTPAAAGRAGAGGSGGGGGSGDGSRQPSPPPVLSRAAADGQPLGGFGSGQWHGFREGQIVWAKMPGYPHWPAQVQQPTQDAWDILEPTMQRPVFVVFFGTKDFQWLSAGKLLRFRDSYRARAAVRNPDLQRALNDAWWHIGEPKP